MQPGSFGHPSRRVTDALLVANVVAYGLQLASKEVLTFWGIKVVRGGRGGVGWVDELVGGRMTGLDEDWV